MGNKPTASLVLLILGGLFMIGGGALTALVGQFAGNVVSHSTSNFIVNGKSVTGAQLASSTSGVLGIDGLVGIIAGIVVILSGIMAYISASKNTKNVKLFGAIALVFALVSLLDLGGYVLGFILALIGSILAIVYKG